jgi:hypothetical protein
MNTQWHCHVPLLELSGEVATHEGGLSHSPITNEEQLELGLFLGLGEWGSHGEKGQRGK